MIENKSVYDAPAVGADYGRQAHLQPAEETILQIIRPLEQIAELSGAFRDMRVFSSVSGAEIGDQIKLRCIEDP